jgi:hypothetical protein
MSESRELAPLDARPHFAPLRAQLLALLGELRAEEWQRRVSTSWTVRDVAAHLLDGDCRQLSFGRDGLPLLPPERPIRGPADLLGFLDELNAVWVKAAKRLSPPLLVELLELSGRLFEAYAERLDPQGEAIFAVAWAGEERSRNWMHLARELTERFHHQQQIRAATGRPLLEDPTLVGAALEAFLYGVPPAYADVTAALDTAVEIRIGAPVSHRYSLVRDVERWRLARGAEHAVATIELDPESAWLALTRSIPKSEAQRRARLSGAPPFTEPFFDTCSIHKRPVEAQTPG